MQSGSGHGFGSHKQNSHPSSSFPVTRRKSSEQWHFMIGQILSHEQMSHPSSPVWMERWWPLGHTQSGSGHGFGSHKQKSHP
jgi:hypothetical protein